MKKISPLAIFLFLLLGHSLWCDKKDKKLNPIKTTKPPKPQKNKSPLVTPVITGNYTSSIETDYYSDVFVDEEFSIDINIHSRTSYNQIRISYSDKIIEDLTLSENICTAYKNFTSKYIGFQNFYIETLNNEPLKTFKKVFVKPIDFSRNFIGQKLIGCYENIYNWTEIALANQSEILMTNELCSLFCFHNYQQISATANGYQCFCMRKNIAFKNKTDECRTPCNGNHNDTCGGDQFVSVFEIEYESIVLSCNPNDNLHLNQETKCWINVKSNHSTFNISSYFSYEDKFQTFLMSENSFQFNQSYQRFGEFTIEILEPNLNLHYVKTIHVKGVKILCPEKDIQIEELFNISIKFYGYNISLEIDFGNSTKLNFSSNYEDELIEELNFTLSYNKINDYKIDVFYNNENDMCTVRVVDDNFLDLNEFKTIIKYFDQNYDISDCLTNCSKNGLCKLEANKKYKCFCFQGFFGKKCEFSKSVCKTRPCLNDGICTEYNSTKSSTIETFYSFFCKCSDSYEGFHCEKLRNDYCKNKTCSFNGYCYFNESIKQANCRCFKYHSGNDCEMESEDGVKVRTAATTTTFIAILILIFFYLMMFFMDLHNCFRRDVVRKKKNKIKVYKLVYKN